ncbi:ATP-binding protein [Alloalcanivorax xenomutans]|uniref:ATP-binding protein n=1 Tax=Alloalcanivorax xenomutans TaxID=1094342 RepID=UPI003BA9CB92
MSDNAETTHLRRLVRLRYVMLIGQVLVVASVWLALGVPLPLVPMVTLMLVLLLVNLVTHYRLRGDRPVAQWEVAVQLLVDIAQLTGLLYLSGGHANPFIFMLLAPLVIAAAMLTLRHTLALASVALLCYSLLLIDYMPLPMLEQLAWLPPPLLRRTGMWLCFVVSAGMVIFFVVRTRQTLRQMDAELSQARERAMENEHLAEIGAIAAGTAHELGTPLATISMLAQELEGDLQDPELRARLVLLRQQVNRCRHTIDDLSDSIRELRSERGNEVGLNDWLEGLARRWRSVSPDVTLQLNVGRYPEGLTVRYDRAMDHALSTVVANACRASDQVTIIASVETGQLVIEVRDQGPGIPDALVPYLGREPLGGHAGVEGSGLGIYLAMGIVRRLGGSLVFHNREGGGAVACFRLPVERIRREPTEHEYSELEAYPH